jgi:hypothetical protein
MVLFLGVPAVYHQLFFVFCSVLSVVPTVSLLSVVFRFLAGSGSGSLVWFSALWQCVRFDSVLGALVCFGSGSI